MSESIPGTPSGRTSSSSSGFLWAVLVFVLAAAIGAGVWSAWNRRAGSAGAVDSSSASSASDTAGSPGSPSGSASAPAAIAGSRSGSTETAATPGALPAALEIPNFSLTDRGGKTVSRQDLDGKIWIADFIFTRCPNVCPDLTRKMSIIRKKLEEKSAGDIVSVSFSVDPVYDTPPVLEAYAREFHAETPSWIFLTGNPQDMVHLVNGGFQLAMADPTTGPPAHSNRFVLVDRQGRARASFLASEPGLVDTVVSEAMRLRAEPRG